MGLVSLPPHHLPSFSPEFAHSLHTLFCHSSIFPNIREMIGGQWWAFIFTNKKQEAARTTLFKTCAQGPQPPNLLPWLWKQIKPTGLGLIGGAGGALGFTTNGDWGRLAGSYGKGHRKILGGFYSSAGGSDQQGHLQ